MPNENYVDICSNQGKSLYRIGIFDSKTFSYVEVKTVYTNEFQEVIQRLRELGESHPEALERMMVYLSPLDVKDSQKKIEEIRELQKSIISENTKKRTSAREERGHFVEYLDFSPAMAN